MEARFHHGNHLDRDPAVYGCSCEQEVASTSRRHKLLRDREETFAAKRAVLDILSIAWTWGEAADWAFLKISRLNSVINEAMSGEHCEARLLLRFVIQPLRLSLLQPLLRVETHLV